MEQPPVRKEFPENGAQRIVILRMILMDRIARLLEKRRTSAFILSLPLPLSSIILLLASLSCGAARLFLPAESTPRFTEKLGPDPESLKKFQKMN